MSLISGRSLILAKRYTHLAKLFLIILVSGIPVVSSINHQPALAVAPGSTSSPPSVSNWGPDHLNAFVLGSDGSIWNNPYFKNTTDPRPTWHKWAHAGNAGDPGHPPNVSITSAPAAISRDIASRMIDVFATGSDKGVWRLCFNGGNWGQWAHAGNAGDPGHPPNVSITSAPAVTSWSSADLHVFARGSDNNVWYNYFHARSSGGTCNGTWSGWQVVNSSTSSDSVQPTSLKKLGFEKGVGPPSGAWEWDSAQYAAPDRLTAVTSPIKEGSHALKATVQHGDIASGGARAEVLLNNKSNYFHEGDNVWYHWYTMFPSGFQTTAPWQVWTQWHQGDDSLGGGPAVEFNVDGKTKNLDLRVMPWYWDSKSCYTVAAGQCGYQWVEPIKTGVWYDILFHVKWSKDSNVGYVELWVNSNKVVPCSGCSTHMATLDTRDPTASVYLKQGLYLKDVITQPQSIFHDGMRVAKCPADHQYYHPDTEICYTSPPYT
jgi:hypothetical protein